MPRPNLTKRQLELDGVRRRGVYGQMIGVVIGCILGCAPLLFLDSEKAERQKAKCRQDRLLSVVTNEICRAMKAERATLFLVQKREDGSKVLHGRSPMGVTFDMTE